MADPCPVGRRNHRLLYQTRSDTADALGQPQPDWEDGGTYWAEVRTPSGKELMQAGGMQLVGVLSHVLTMRHPGFVPDQKERFIEGQAVYNVASAFDPDGRRRTLVVFATRDPAETP